MKKTIYILVAAVLMGSCMNVKQIGKLNMISNRNIDSKMDYANLNNYAGGSKKELRKLKSKTLEGAIDNVVKKTTGGEFLKNVKIYVINSKYFAVEGDVWGYPQTTSTNKK